MATQLDYNTEQRIDKALKQLPYKQSKKDFIATAIDDYLKELLKKRVITQGIGITKIYNLFLLRTKIFSQVFLSVGLIINFAETNLTKPLRLCNYFAPI